jgi:hypothetical protein
MRRRAAPGDGRSSPKERSPSRHARRERHPPLTPDDLPNDFEETVLETFHETETEAQITMILAELPDDVIKAIEDYETAHSVDRDRLLELATIARAARTDLLGQACAQLIDDPRVVHLPDQGSAFMYGENTPWVGVQCVQKSISSVMTRPSRLNS